MVTVEDVLRLALPPASRAVIAEGLDRPVTGVVLLRSTPPALPTLRGGEVVLLTPSNLAMLDDGLNLQLFVERLATTPTAAIGVAGVIDQPAQAAARRARLPLLELPQDTDLREVHREVQRLINDPEAQMERRAAQLFSALTRVSLGGGDVPALLDVLARWTGREVHYLPGRPDRPAAAVMVSGRHKGSIVVEGDHPWDRLAAEQAAAAIALILDKERAVQEAEDRFRGRLVDMLIAGAPFDVAGTLRRAQELGYDLTRPHSVLLLAPENGIAAERLEAGLRRELERANIHAPLAHRSGTIFCLYPPVTVERSTEELRSLHQRLLAAGLHASGSMSGPGMLETWPAAAQEAEQTLLLGRRIFGPAQLVSAADLGIYKLLLQYDRAELQRFYECTIGLLVAYEGRPDGELIQTLSVYCAQLGNQARAARMLHIHRNTLLYRLERISQLTGLDLNNEEDRLALQIGLRIHRLFQTSHTGR